MPTRFRLCGASPTALLVALTVLAGCAHQQAENPALGGFSGMQGQIESFYNANATEDDWVCDEPQIANIDKSKVVSQSATRVRVAVNYYFTSFDQSPGRGGNQCQGFNTRFFTFDKGPGGQLSLVSMSGPQRGQNG